MGAVPTLEDKPQMEKKKGKVLRQKGRRKENLGHQLKREYEAIKGRRG